MSRVLGPDEEKLVRVVVGTKYPFGGCLGGVYVPPLASLHPRVLHHLAAQEAENVRASLH